MKNIITTICLGLLLILNFNLSGQGYFDYFKAGDFEAIKVRLNDEVNIQINREKKTVSSQKAIEILKNQYNSFHPVKWEVLHLGESEDEDAKYFIAKMFNAQDEALRLFVHMEGNGASRKISSIRFRKLL